MKISNEVKLDFDDVLLVPQRSIVESRKDVKLIKTYKFYHSYKCWNGIPIVASNMDTTGTIAMSKALKEMMMVTCLHKHYSKNELINLFRTSIDIQSSTWVSIGMSDVELNNISILYNRTGIMPNICIDIANGYTEKFVKFCSKVRERLGVTPIIMAGNVATPEMVQELIIHGGVDIVKVGIGPGSACTTRLKTGVGYPQLSAIDECASAAHGLKSEDKRHGLICADGGCRTPADVAKAFAAGADFVMLGGMLAGSDECEGKWEYKVPWDHPDQNEDYKTLWLKEIPDPLDYVPIEYKPNYAKKVKSNLLFYGMSSEKAQEKYGDGLKEYRSSEGRVKKVPYKGPVNNIMNDILGGLRSTCTYSGATSLKDLPKTAKFVRVNRVHYDRSI